MSISTRNESAYMFNLVDASLGDAGYTPSTYQVKVNLVDSDLKTSITKNFQGTLGSVDFSSLVPESIKIDTHDLSAFNALSDTEKEDLLEAESTWFASNNFNISVVTSFVESITPVLQNITSHKYKLNPRAGVDIGNISFNTNAHQNLGRMIARADLINPYYDLSNGAVTFSTYITSELDGKVQYKAVDASMANVLDLNVTDASWGLDFFYFDNNDHGVTLDAGKRYEIQINANNNTLNGHINYIDNIVTINNNSNEPVTVTLSDNVNNQGTTGHVNVRVTPGDVVADNLKDTWYEIKLMVDSSDTVLGTQYIPADILADICDNDVSLNFAPLSIVESQSLTAKARATNKKGRTFADISALVESGWSDYRDAASAVELEGIPGSFSISKVDTGVDILTQIGTSLTDFDTAAQVHFSVAKENNDTTRLNLRLLEVVLNNGFFVTAPGASPILMNDITTTDSSENVDVELVSVGSHKVLNIKGLKNDALYDLTLTYKNNNGSVDAKPADKVKAVPKEHAAPKEVEANPATSATGVNPLNSGEIEILFAPSNPAVSGAGSHQYAWPNYTSFRAEITRKNSNGLVELVGTETKSVDINDLLKDVSGDDVSGSSWVQDNGLEKTDASYVETSGYYDIQVWDPSASLSYLKSGLVDGETYNVELIMTATENGNAYLSSSLLSNVVIPYGNPVLNANGDSVFNAINWAAANTETLDLKLKASAKTAKDWMMANSNVAALDASISEITFSLFRTDVINSVDTYTGAPIVSLDHHSYGKFTIDYDSNGSVSDNSGAVHINGVSYEIVHNISEDASMNISIRGKTNRDIDILLSNGDEPTTTTMITNDLDATVDSIALSNGDKARQETTNYYDIPALHDSSAPRAFAKLDVTGNVLRGSQPIANDKIELTLYGSKKYLDANGDIAEFAVDVSDNLEVAKVNATVGPSGNFNHTFNGLMTGWDYKVRGKVTTTQPNSNSSTDSKNTNLAHAKTKLNAILTLENSDPSFVDTSNVEYRPNGTGTAALDISLILSGESITTADSTDNGPFVDTNYVYKNLLNAEKASDVGQLLEVYKGSGVSAYDDQNILSVTDLSKAAVIILDNNQSSATLTVNQSNY